MKVVQTPIAGVHLIEVDAVVDARGLFARTFCSETFAAHGLATHFPQANTSWNAVAGTLRGLHYQAHPVAEAKLVRATRGRCFDVAVDLRPTSPTFRRWTSTVLDAARRNAIYIPPGCAHGFVTLVDDCELIYMMSATYAPDLARTVRWNDPAFAIAWPHAPVVIAPRDETAPNFQGDNPL